MVATQHYPSVPLGMCNGPAYSTGAREGMHHPGWYTVVTVHSTGFREARCEILGFPLHRPYNTFALLLLSVNVLPPE